MNTVDVGECKTPRKLTEQTKFAWKFHKIPIILTGSLLLIIIIDFFIGWTLFDPIKERWNNDLEQLVSLATLMVALFVWWGEITQDWRNRLPKRLTIYFQYIDENNNVIIVMKCIRAHLSGVSDIRALGQQIGLQMSNEKKLFFRAAYIRQDEGTIQSDEEIGYYLHYQVTFTLTELPKSLPPNTCRIWKPPFDKENEVDENIREFEND